MKRKLIPLAFVVIASVGMSSCGSNKTIVRIGYDDFTTINPLTERTEYDKNLFYRNDRSFYCPDPSIMQITDPNDPDYNWFYLYGTTGGKYKAYKSQDLTNWQPAGPVMNYWDTANYPDQSYALDRDNWAPEAIYDPEAIWYSDDPNDPDNGTKGVYYFFTSATPVRGEWYIPYIAKGKTPRHFELISHPDYKSYRDGTKLLKDNDPDYYTFLQYTVFDPYEMKVALTRLGLPCATYCRGIDLHPFVDPKTNNKFLFFTYNGDAQTYVLALQMKDWETPMYETLTRITKTQYKTVDGDQVMSYEYNNIINEGTQVLYHEDKNGVGRYYLTISINGYADKTYKVIQAVNDGSSPLAPYTKLEESEGGILLSSDGSTRDDVSGPGHHAFVTVEDQLYIIYHKHDDPNVGGGARHPCVDRVSWITVKDEKGQDLEVMYVNGPTTSIQPMNEFASDYRNVALDAKITATNVLKDSKVENLNDGLLDIYSIDNYEAYKGVVESTKFSDSTDITITFDDYIPIKALMVYNSKFLETAFYDVSLIEFDAKDENGNLYTAGIEDLAFDLQGALNTINPKYIRPGYSSIAEFNEMNVKEIRIHVDPATLEEIPEHADEANEYEQVLEIPEIVVLGRK